MYKIPTPPVVSSNLHEEDRIMYIIFYLAAITKLVIYLFVSTDAESKSK